MENIDTLRNNGEAVAIGPVARRLIEEMVGIPLTDDTLAKFIRGDDCDADGAQAEREERRSHAEALS